MRLAGCRPAGSDTHIQALADLSLPTGTCAMLGARATKNPHIGGLLRVTSWRAMAGGQVERVACWRWLAGGAA